MKRLTQRGDTIIEVLISMAIISLILGGAFVTTRRSQVAVLDSQEHATALKLIEGQLEQVRADAAANGSNSMVFSPAMNPFCIYNGSPVLTTGSSNCKQDSSGNRATVEPEYALSIQRNSSINGGYTFNITAAWDALSGNGQAQEQMAYRLYP